MKNILVLGFFVLGTGAFAENDSQSTYVELRKEIDTLVICENNVAELNNRLSASGPACQDLQKKVAMINASYNKVAEKWYSGSSTAEDDEARKTLESALTAAFNDAKLECSESVQISRVDAPNQRTILILKKPFRVSQPSEWNGQICVTVTQDRSTRNKS